MNENYQLHLKITDILDLNEVQSLLLKYWYHGLINLLRKSATFGLVKGQKIVKIIGQKQQIRPLTPRSKQLLNVTFQNCQQFGMSIEDYEVYLGKIQKGMGQFSLKSQLGYILQNVGSTKMEQIKYEMFSMHYFQLFGNVLAVLSSRDVAIIMRRVFFSITYQTEKGAIKLHDEPKAAEVGDIIQLNEQNDESEQVQEQRQVSVGSSQRVDSQIKQFLPSIETQQRQMNQNYFYKSEISRAHRNKLDYHNSFSQNYSVDDTLRKRDKASLSAYAYSGFEIVDYSEPLHKLHKKLLKKIILNR